MVSCADGNQYVGIVQQIFATDVCLREQIHAEVFPTIFSRVNVTEIKTIL
jgi:hypothetical protein